MARPIVANNWAVTIAGMSIGNLRSLTLPEADEDTYQVSYNPPQGGPLTEQFVKQKQGPWIFSVTAVFERDLHLDILQTPQNSYLSSQDRTSPDKLEGQVVATDNEGSTALTLDLKGVQFKSAHLAGDFSAASTTPVDIQMSFSIDQYEWS